MDCSDVRKSVRKIHLKRAYSPEPISSSARKSKGDGASSNKHHGDYYNGKLFSCDKCKSPYIINPYYRRNRKSGKKSVQPKVFEDSEAASVLILCLSCAADYGKEQNSNGGKEKQSSSDKDKYLKDAQEFSTSLVEYFNDSDAERLFCPEIRTHPCACIQKFIVGQGETSSGLYRRALHLLNLFKEARKLSKLKCYDLSEVSGDGSKVCHVGLGNGQKKSQQFETFVIEQRRKLRTEFGLCERATQQVLTYSNNFLHKRLKTEPEKGQRVQRVKGKAALGKLKPVEELLSESCCRNKCTVMAATHATLLQQWRERSTMGQAETRRVLAEMLTPSGGGTMNCYKFIALVTGCSFTTISRVNEQMRQSGGSREPPEHGLKRWWQEQAKKQLEVESSALEPDCIPVREEEPQPSVPGNTECCAGARDVLISQTRQPSLNVSSELLLSQSAQHQKSSSEAQGSISENTSSQSNAQAVLESSCLDTDNGNLLPGNVVFVNAAARC